MAEGNNYSPLIYVHIISFTKIYILSISVFLKTAYNSYFYSARSEFV